MIYSYIIRIIFQGGSDECGGAFGRLYPAVSWQRNRPYKVGFFIRALCRRWINVRQQACQAIRARERGH